MRLIELADVTKCYRVGRQIRTAVSDVSLGVDPGEIVGLVGESGSGKSTLARLALRLLAPDSGAVLFEGRDLARGRGPELAAFRRRVQIVFQDPLAALNPRASVGRLIGEPLRLHRIVPARDVAREMRRLMEGAGLPSAYAERRPRQISGGERQRVAILRALACRPQILVCDEPVASLDVSVRAQILGLLLELRRTAGLGILFISHDLAVVRRIADRLAVMLNGRIVEEGPSERIWQEPSHPYTRTLLAAVPRGEPGAGRRRRFSPLHHP
jgi:ABC-type glutathione transport system ATPase component